MNKLFFTLFAILSLQTADAQEIPKWKLADLKNAIANAEQPTIINFWATWCKPCIEEMPYLQELAKQYENQGVKLILVSLDMLEYYPGKLKALAKKHKITAPVVFLDETDADLFCPAVDKEWSGAIPASLFINNKTGYRKFHESQLSKESLETEIRAMIATEKPA